MFNPRAFENSRSDGIPVLEIVNGKPPGADEPHLFVPLKRTELKGQIVGPLAALRLIQTYGYTAAQSDKALEALYRFPLPGDAAVTSVRVRFGDVEIRTQLKERRQAEGEYVEAKHTGQQALLATRESPDVFTLRVAGLRPDQDIVVETEYVQLARTEGAGWSLRIPLTTAPRYLRSDELTSRHAQGEPLLLLRDPGHRFRLDLTLHEASTVQSSTHKIDVRQESNRTFVCLKEGEVRPDRDCVLSWRAVQEQDRPGLEVQVQDDRSSAKAYFIALVAPPATHERGRGLAREVVLLVDHSGSMNGPKWQAADWAVERFLAELTERDFLALGLFHNTTRWFDKKPRSASAQLVAEAVAFLKKHRDSGGTELGVALEQALGLDRHAGESARHVLVITDAEVTDAGRIVRLADQESKRADHRRISVLCIDAAPNSLLATELAERGGGVARFVTSQPEEEDITTALEGVLADWSEPVLSGLRLEVNRSQIEAAGRLAREASAPGWSAIDLGDLPAGRPVWVAGRVPRGEANNLVFRVTTAKGQQIASGKQATPQGDDVRSALKALFGARRIRGLEYLIHSGYTGDELAAQLRHLGYDPKAVLGEGAGKSPKVYAENVREEANAALRDLLVRESLDYGLASAETAFIAVRSEAGKPIDETVVVANALPAGWAPETVAFGAIMGTAAHMSLRFGAVADSAFALQPEITPTIVFSGAPQFDGTEAVLFDSDQDQKPFAFPDLTTFDCLEVRFPEGSPDFKDLDPGLCLLLYVDDLASPRARVRLVDIVRQGGQRPLNILRQAGQVVRLVLADPAGTWKHVAPKFEVALGCR